MYRHLSLPDKAADFHSEIARHSGDAQLTYKVANGQSLRISLFHPPKYTPEKKYPLLVWIHGGGWNSRKIFDDQTDWAGDHLGFLARRYADRGYLCACVDYRLMRDEGQTPGYELFDLYEDCADALDFLLELSGKLGINQKRVAVLGESAGGHLAAAMATFPWRNRDQLRTAVLLNPITDLTETRWRNVVPRQSAHPELQGVSMAEKQLLLSPAHHICEKVCPTLIVHGAQDTVVFPYHAQKFHDLLVSYGRQVRLDWIADTDHAFMLAEYMRELGTPLNALTVSLDGIDHWLDFYMFN